MIQLRSAKKNDVETIVQILSSSRTKYLPYAKSIHTLDEDRRWVGQTLIPSNDVVIAQVVGIDVGVLATTVIDECGWIEQLYLSPGNVGKGIGAAMLTHAFSVLPRPIRLWTFQENKRAIKFYENHGFYAVRYTDGNRNEEKCPDVLYECR